MNNKMLFISFVTLGFLITSLLLLVWLLQQNKPLYDQLGEAILKADPNYNEIVHLHADQKQTIAFYKTNKSELGVLSLKKNFRRYEVDDYLGKTSIFTDQKLSWHGTEKQESNIHLLYGLIKDPDITQIFLISEGNKTAQMINDGEIILWYSLIESRLKRPITIQATNREGKIMYEYGDVDFWSKAKIENKEGATFVTNN